MRAEQNSGTDTVQYLYSPLTHTRPTDGLLTPTTSYLLLMPRCTALTTDPKGTTDLILLRTSPNR